MCLLYDPVLLARFHGTRGRYLILNDVDFSFLKFSLEAKLGVHMVCVCVCVCVCVFNNSNNNTLK